ncbi:MAG: type II toxin-antitoxin system VapC family toxin [Desulfofustis sp. PB-SRB1]|jgi:PIN domain nuclease of toxin-antitoxin system|nr:type II toxin-antitoxin system VapC family toxin [Desulfofustis sp. PB-SRB1]MBM1003834.1 type II toxin-antitoxin system VapC family toxin [Desulfofustis sp. PB-SRB1]HBH27524.1 type II toxin-antitoxin system VapC family toxin [Desulfofustis sp.]HBH31310.1 type II toxin-antitoxin system VapC family toxin [Desulfofustis sp.]
MDVLLDTCTFLWVIFDAPELSDTARRLFQKPENKVFLSAASSWELTIKQSLGRLSLPESAGAFVTSQREKHNIETLAITEAATFHLATLPLYHKDPFDRIIVCQAIEHSLVILTPDHLISHYPVRVLW